MHRQTRLDAAHDDVDGVGELGGEFLDAALAQEADEPARNPQAEEDRQGRQDEPRHPEQQSEQQGEDGQARRDHPEDDGPSCHAGLAQLGLHGHARLAFLAILLLELEHDLLAALIGRQRTGRPLGT
jgi:hypothetical protein